MNEKELSVSEILILALSVLKKRFGQFAWLLLMFFVPVSAILAVVALRMPDLSMIADPEVLAMETVRAYTPYLLWMAGLQFFLLLVPIIVDELTYNELFETERLSLRTALSHSYLCYLPAALALLAIGLSFLLVLFFGSTILLVSPVMMALFALPLLLYLVYLGLMKNASAVVAVHTGLGGWKNTAFVSMLFRERFWRVLGVWGLILAVALLPELLLNILAMFGLDLIENEILAEIAAAAASVILSLFDIYTAICASILVNNYANLRRGETEEENGKTVDS